jgi:predicted transcriptional regulator
MTKIEIDAVLERVRSWSPARQADLARIALIMEAQDGRTEPADEATRAAVREGLSQARRGKYGSDKRIAEIWKKFGL